MGVLRTPILLADEGKTTARQTARMPRSFEDAANCFLEMAYVDMFCASVGLSTTYGISIFVWFLALCRVVEKKGADDQALGRSRGGFSTKVHVAVDALGNPVKVLLTAGQAHDLSKAKEL